LANTNIYHLKNVDYSERGQTLEIIVGGVAKPQTVIFSGIDCLGEKYYFTEQGLRYITDSRNDRPIQRFVLNHFDKTPTILKEPLIIARSLETPDNYLYIKDVAIKERGHQKLLFVVILKKSNIHAIWNFYWLSENRIPRAVEIIHRNQGSAKYLR